MPVAVIAYQRLDPPPPRRADAKMEHISLRQGSRAQPPCTAPYGANSGLFRSLSIPVCSRYTILLAVDGRASRAASRPSSASALMTADSACRHLRPSSLTPRRSWQRKTPSAQSKPDHGSLPAADDESCPAAAVPRSGRAPEFPGAAGVTGAGHRSSWVIRFHLASTNQSGKSLFLQIIISNIIKQSLRMS